MSLIVSWIAVDSRNTSSAYIASDSRVSWSENGRIKEKYDACRKTFFFKNYPEIIAYCGDVLFPSLLLSTLIETVDNGMIFGKDDIAIKRYEKFKKCLFDEFHKYPKRKIIGSFELLYINKEITEDLYPCFYSYLIEWNNSEGFKSKSISIPKVSGIIHIMGSGKYEFEKIY